MKKNIFSDDIFKVAFAISIASHAILLLKSPSFSFVPNNKEVEITYIEQKPSVPQNITKLDMDVPGETSKNKVSVEKAAEKVIAPEKYPEEEKVKKVVKQEKKEEVSRKPQNRIVIKEDVKSVTDGEEKDVLYNSAEFYDYHRYLRDRIRQTIFHPRPFSQGEVVVKFALFCDGVLKEVSVVDNLSANNAYLRYAAIKSVKDAAPFKSFPEKLAAKEMLFQIPISFELSE